MTDHVKTYFERQQSLLNDCKTDEFMRSIVEAAQFMFIAIRNGKKILACGNGGSMSDAMHFASELSGRYKDTRDPIAAMALSDPGAMSCIANDFGYEKIFDRQIDALANRGDVLLAISTSGTSINVIRAVMRAKELGMRVIGLTGIKGMAKSYCDIEIKVPSLHTNYVQQVHIMVIHLLVELIEKDVNYYSEKI